MSARRWNDMIWNQWILDDCEEVRAYRQRTGEARERMVRSVRDGKPTSPFEDTLWKHGILAEFLKRSTGPFRGKCAYCDGPAVTPGARADIDHFRPKGSVRHADGRIVVLRVDVSGKPIKHPGYYWLAYELENFRLACQRCNREYKRDYFPVAGEHSTSTDDDAAEEAILVDPCGPEDPARHIGILRNGVVFGRTYKGKITIEVFGLNERGLPDSRRDAYEQTCDWAAKYLNFDPDIAPAVYKRRLQKVLDARSGHFTHTLARRLACRDVVEKWAERLGLHELPTEIADLISSDTVATSFNRSLLLAAVSQP
jgi:hypothetical protein